MIKRLSRCFLSQRSRFHLRFDWLRLKARLKHQFNRKDYHPGITRLHFGCGQRIVPGWMNVDVAGSPFDLDLTIRLPFPDHTFEAIVGQQVVEHLDLLSELIPFLRDLHRVSKPGGEIWLSTPDMEKVCQGYIDDKGLTLKIDRFDRNDTLELHGSVPAQHIINVLFHQGGEHKNLYDLDLLTWALKEAGFSDCQRTSETDFLVRFPEFPTRGDNWVSLYVYATA